MTRDEILALAGTDLGDTSADFLTDVLNPAFDRVLADLAQHEAIGAVQRSHPFTVSQDARVYDTREICGLGQQYPVAVLTLRIWAWGAEGAPREASDTEYERRRFTDGEDQRGRWQLWRLYPNIRLLEVHPPADADNAGAECEILFLASPQSIARDDDLIEVLADDVETVTQGLIAHGGDFFEGMDKAAALALYMQGRSRMWGRRFNSRPLRVRSVRP